MPKSSLRSVLANTLSAQLGNPSGLLGSLVARKLNDNNRPTITAAVEALGHREAAAVADIGFGGGVGLELLLAADPAARVHGVEPSQSMITRAGRHWGTAVKSGRLTLHLASMHDLPFTDGQLDGWITLNTVYFIDDLAPALRELARVLTADGVGVLGAADPTWLAAQPFAQTGFIVRPIAELTSALADAGLAVERRTVNREGDEGAYSLLVCRHR